MQCLQNARWIWLPEEGINQYADFRQSFTLPESPGMVTLYISADSRYAVYINGCHVPASQYADYPHYKVYDTVDITDYVHAGSNVLAVVGYFQGEDCSVYRVGQAGVWFAILPEQGAPLYSGADTLCRLSREYSSGEVERFSGQLSFSFRYRAAGCDGWQKEDYIPGTDWQPATETGANPPLYPRPIQPLTLRAPRPVKVIAQGVFWDDAPMETPCGERMQRTSLAFRNAAELGLPPLPVTLPVTEGVTLSALEGDGIWLMMDLGGEEAGVPEWEIDLPCEATVLFGFGEHLEDLRVRTSVGGRQFAAVYEGVPGRQRFTHYFKRTGCRYVQLHIYARSCTLYYAGVRPTTYPLTYRPAFRCADSMHNRIYELGRRTLELCMHEHYEDCPWREQALYAMDSRNQMLCGYYAFGETDFARSSLRLLALGMRADGLLELCAPARVSITIPAFSLNFITAMREYVEFSGDSAFGEEMLSTVRRILDTFWGRREENGLVPRLVGAEYWNFYEWQPGLDGGKVAGCDDTTMVFDAPLNGFLALALEDAAKLYARLDRETEAADCRAKLQELRQAMALFWDDAAGVYATSLSENTRSHFSELTQALCVCSGVAQGEHRERVLSRLASADSGLVSVTLSCTLFKYEALMQEPEQYGRWVLENIARVWGDMLCAGATSFWETELGAADFFRAGSLCHGWSAVPVYIYCRYVLGEKLDGSRVSPVACGVYEARRAKE